MAENEKIVSEEQEDEIMGRAKERGNKVARTDGGERWLNDVGLKHRDYGPADISADGKSKMWYKDGRPVRLEQDVVLSDGTKLLVFQIYGEGGGLIHSGHIVKE